MAALNPNYQAIEYAANTKLMDLAVEIAETRKASKRDKLIDQAAKIRYFLKAVGYKTTYLTNTQVNNIYECLVDVSEINDFPVVPNLPTVTVPSINVGPQGPQGEQGPAGADGGGTDFSKVLVATDTVIDTFLATEAYAARWEFVIYDGTNFRAGWLIANWDGTNLTSTGELGSDEIGDTSGIVMSAELNSGSVRLFATVTSGSWTVSGSRYFIPNNGNYTPVYNTLANGTIYIGDSSNYATSRSVTGDVTISNTGVTSIANGVIVNSDVSASAALALSKLAALTASRAAATDSSGVLTTSSVTSTELGYLSGVTSSIQTQLDSKIGAASGAISTVVSTNLTANRAVVSNPSGKIAVSGTTSTELSYLSGVTSNIQTQLSGKISTSLTRGNLIIGNASNVAAAVALGTSGYVLTSNGTDAVWAAPSIPLVGGGALNIKVVNIGDWNMDSTSSVNVATGIDVTTVRSVDVIIRDDSGELLSPLIAYGGSSAYYYLNGVTDNITLQRLTGGNYDSPSYNATSFNRGWIYLVYTA